MANTLTSLTPTIYEALDIVSRELVGFIPSVTRDTGIERAAVNQSVLSFVAPASTAADITPGVTAPNDGDQAIGNVEIKITKARGVPIRWNGEESRGLSHGPGRQAIMVDQFAQAMRTLTNEIEVDLGALHVGFSRAYGSAGTTPFASDMSDTAQLRKILDDNGCPGSERKLVIDTAAGAKMRTMAQLTKANEAGTTGTLRQGELLDINGFSIRESSAVKSSVAGTAVGATTNNAGYAVGATVLTLASAGTGTLVAGDVVTFAGDTNKYVIASGDADVSNGGTITLAAPGLRVAMSAATKAITVIAAAARNMAFRRSALVLVQRSCALPVEGDMADDAMMITDPISGLNFEVRLYKQYRQIRYEIATAWGVANVKPEHTALLLG
jgi:hypothetical protein